MISSTYIMSQNPPPPPKGRAAMLMKLFEERKPGAEQQAEQPPKPKGRAALLKKLGELRAAQSVGAEGPSTSTASAVQTQKKVEEVTQRMAETTVAEPCFYKGKGGTPTRITANYIRLNVEKDRGVYEYVVKFEPTVDSKHFRIKILNSNMPKMGNIKMFDGGSILFLPIQLPDRETDFETQHPTDPSVTITMTVTFLRKKRLADCLQLYNILFKRIMHELLYVCYGRNFFDRRGSILIPQHRLEVLPGYAVAVDEYEGGLMLCLDTQHRVLRTITVLEFLKEYRTLHRERFKEVASNHLIGSVVLTKYNHKTYVIDEILWTNSPKDTFDTFDGGKISYMEYYQKQHNLQINDVNQPLLLHRKSIRVAGSLEKVDRFICLVPELCHMTGLTDEMRSDFKVMKDVAQYTRVTPNQRMSALRKYLNNVASSEKAQQILRDWGLELHSASIDLQARVLDPETIAFHECAVFRCNEKAEFSNAVANNKILGPVDFLDWVIVHTEKDGRIARDFVENVRRLAASMGNEVRPAKMFALKDDRTETYINACRQLITNATQVLVFICPTVRSDRYSAIKKMCCTQMPVASQVILSRTLMNQQKVRAITQKIAYQIVCKLGGSLWSLRFPFKKWMIVGIDVYHSKGLKSSVCAFVASMENTITKWHSQTAYQEREIGDHLKAFFIRALELYRDKNGEFPSKIIVFRDGVGDGQLDHCRRYEIPQFEATLKEFQVTDCGLCYVIVQKRINTRMFAVKGGDHLDNPLPGTVLDYEVTRRNLYDFFLVSQFVRQGTVTPTHYIVLHDTSNVAPDHIQRLTQKMCHLYYNWPGTIRVPAPCQYAHKLAQLVGQYIGKPPSDKLSERLFYL